MTFYSTASGSGWIVPKKYVEEVGDDGFQEGADRRRPVQIRLVQSRGRAGARGVRRLLAQDARRQAAGDEGHPRRVDPACRAEGRRSRYRLFDPRRSGEGIAGDARADAEIGRAAGDELDLFPGAVGSEIAVAQIARCGRPPISRSTATGGTTRCSSAGARSTTASSRIRSIITGSRPKRSTIRQRRESCWPKPDIRTASMPGRSRSTPPIRISARLRSIRCSRSASARDCSRSSGPRFSQAYASKKLNKGIFRGGERRVRQRRHPACRRLSSRTGPLCMAAIPISMSCFRSRPTNSTARSARQILHKMQQLVYEKAIFAPIWELAFINGVGPRLGESSFGRIAGFPYTAPFEDLTIQKG